MTTLDRSALDQLRALCGDTASELIAEFVEQTSAYLARMRAAAGEADWGTVQRLSHTLKGSAATFGARRFGGVAERLCASVRAKDGEAPAHLDALEHAWREARAALVALTDAHAST